MPAPYPQGGIAALFAVPIGFLGFKPLNENTYRQKLWLHQADMRRQEPFGARTGMIVSSSNVKEPSEEMGSGRASDKRRRWRIQGWER